MIAAYEGVKVGLTIADVAPDPTDALIAGVTLLAREVDARTAQQQKDALS